LKGVSNGHDGGFSGRGTLRSESLREKREQRISSSGKVQGHGGTGQGYKTYIFSQHRNNPLVNKKGMLKWGAAVGQKAGFAPKGRWEGARGALPLYGNSRTGGRGKRANVAEVSMEIKAKPSLLRNFLGSKQSRGVTQRKVNKGSRTKKKTR